MFTTENVFTVLYAFFLLVGLRTYYVAFFGDTGHVRTWKYRGISLKIAAGKVRAKLVLFAICATILYALGWQSLIILQTLSLLSTLMVMPRIRKLAPVWHREALNLKTLKL